MSSSAARVRRLSQGGDADADGDGPGRERRWQGGDGEAQVFGDFECGFRFGAGQDHGEFLAAVAEHEIIDAHSCGQCLRDGLQHTVAGRVAELVVDALEVIHIDQQQTQWAVGVLGQIHQLAAQAFEAAAMEQAGEAVARGFVAQRFVTLAVGERVEHIADAALESGGERRGLHPAQVGAEQQAVEAGGNEFSEQAAETAENGTPNFRCRAAKKPIWSKASTQPAASQMRSTTWPFASVPAVHRAG